MIKVSSIDMLRTTFKYKHGVSYRLISGYLYIIFLTRIPEFETL